MAQGSGRPQSERVIGISIGAEGPDSEGPSRDRPRRYNDQNIIKYEEYLN